MKEFSVRFMAFPEDMRGKTFGLTSDRGGRAAIIIDNTQPEETQLLTLKHELAHVYLNHYDQHEKELSEKESEAEAMAASMTDIEFKGLLARAVKMYSEVV